MTFQLASRGRDICRFLLKVTEYSIRFKPVARLGCAEATASLVLL